MRNSAQAAPRPSSLSNLVSSGEFAPNRCARSGTSTGRRATQLHCVRTIGGRRNRPDNAANSRGIGGYKMRAVGRGCRVALALVFLTGATWAGPAGHAPALGAQQICSAHPDEHAFLAGNDAAMTRMMAGMSIKPTGDVDRDFVDMMTPHHQG